MLQAESPSIFGDLPLRPPVVTGSTPFRQQSPIKQPLKLNRRDLNLSGFSKSVLESPKTEILSPPPPTTTQPKLPQGPSQKRRKVEKALDSSGDRQTEAGEGPDGHEVVAEERPVVLEPTVVDDHDHDHDHDDEDLEEDDEEHCLSAAQLLRKHRATEFNEEDFEEDYY